MNFFKNIVRSVYSPEFYQTVVKNSFGKALGYFLLFTLVISVIQILWATPGILKFPGEISKFVDEAYKSYPGDLELSVKSGQVTVNVEEPYFIKDDKGINVLVIDTKTPYSATQFEKYATAVWVTKDSIFYVDSNSNGVKTQSLTQFPDTTINRDTISMLIEKVKPYIQYVVPAAIVGGLLLFYSLYSGRLLYLLFLALLVWIVMKVMKKNLTYGQSYKVSMHAVTLAFVVDLISTLVGWGGFPFLFTLLSLGVVIVNFRTVKK